MRSSKAAELLESCGTPHAVNVPRHTVQVTGSDFGRTTNRWDTSRQREER